jgi:guanylate kinase
VEYHFITPGEMHELEYNEKILEKREYKVKDTDGKWLYATVLDDSFSVSKDYITIGTLESLDKLKGCSADGFLVASSIVPIYLDVDPDIRIQRIVKRELSGLHNYSEMCNRWLKDDIDFSQENIDKAKVIKISNNDDIDKALFEITKIIINSI